MSTRSCASSASSSAVFATHLHELESLLARLPTLPSLRWMCLPVAEAAADGRIAMSFTLSEGMSRNSLALHVARGAGLPADLVEVEINEVELTDDPVRLQATLATLLKTQSDRGQVPTEVAQRLAGKAA
jgi:DNA mismatch repair ATPase MutS